MLGYPPQTREPMVGGGGGKWAPKGPCPSIFSPPRALLKDPLFFIKDSPQGPPTANRQLPPTANCQPPTVNCHQPPTINRHQPPTANHCSIMLLWFCVLPMC